jgi:tetratricopeptide (TPR) repeat protein
MRKISNYVSDLLLVVKYDPYNEEARFKLFSYYNRKNKFKLAEEQINFLLEGYSDDDYYHYLKAGLFYHQNPIEYYTLNEIYTNVYDCLNRAIKINPFNEEAIIMLSELYDELELDEEADKVLYDYVRNDVHLINYLGPQDIPKDKDWASKILKPVQLRFFDGDKPSKGNPFFQT